MSQLKNRIEALKRNVEQAQKKDALAERERQQLEMGLRNKERKQMSRMTQEEKKLQEVEEKRIRV